MPAWTCAAALRKISKDLRPNGSDSRAEVGDLHLLGCRDLQHFGTKCVIWCYKFMNKCPRTAKEWRNMHLTKPEVRWDKKRKVAEKNQPSNCNVQKVFISHVAKGSQKTWIVARLWPQTCVLRAIFFCSPNCHCRHAEKLEPHATWGQKWVLMWMVCWGFRSWVLGHGPIHPTTFWGVGVLGMFWGSKYILRRCLDV